GTHQRATRSRPGLQSCLTHIAFVGDATDFVERKRVIRTCLVATLASDALVDVQCDNSIILAPQGVRWARLYAGSVRAMLAHGGNPVLRQPRKYTLGPFEHGLAVGIQHADAELAR